MVVPRLLGVRMQETIVELDITVTRYRPCGSGYVIEANDPKTLLSNRYMSSTPGRGCVGSQWTNATEL